MPTKQVQAYPSTSGFAGALWNAHEHKRAELLGLTIDNQSPDDQTVKLMDGFATDASETGAADAAKAAEYLGVSNVISGFTRLQITVPATESVKLGEKDCKGIEFLGRGTAIASTLTSDCVIIAQYRLK